MAYGGVLEGSTPQPVQETDAGAWEDGPEGSSSASVVTSGVHKCGDKMDVKMSRKECRSLPSSRPQKKSDAEPLHESEAVAKGSSSARVETSSLHQ